MASRRLRKIDVLERDLAAPGLTLAQVQQIATSLKLMRGRYMARPAAELMVDRGDPAASQLAAGLAATPVLGRDPHGDRLRAAFKQTMAKEGIPPEVEEMARDFYERRGEPKGKHHQQSLQADDDWIAKSDTGGLGSFVKKLFGGS
jgi:hypothetical protein